MNDTILGKKLDELVYEIGAMPNSQRKKPILLTQKQEEHLPQESLDCIRIGIKYLLFDLEATRRENAHLKKLLENI